MQKQRLDSWKSIADYLKRSTRTVQRWHADHGMPVHHLRGPKGAAFAYSDEIDEWLPGFSGKTGDDSAPHESAIAARKRSIELTAAADGLWELRSERNIHSISAMYREAIEEDAANAAAFVGLANALIFAAINGMVEGSMAYPRAQEAVNRLSRMQPKRIDGRCCEAWLDFAWNRKWGRARSGLEYVLQHQPLNAMALSGRALLYVAEGALSDAWRCAWEAWTLNALARPLSAELCWISYLGAEYKRALQLISDMRVSGAYGATHAAIEALALIQSGSFGSQLERFETIALDYPHDRTLQGALGYFYARTDQQARARAMIEDLRSTGQKNNTAYAAALVWIGLNRPQDAIESLEASFDAGSKWSLGFRFDPMLKPLLTDRRFRELSRKASPARGGSPSKHPQGDDCESTFGSLPDRERKPAIQRS